jgi:hypothetical protein
MSAPKNVDRLFDMFERMVRNDCVIAALLKCSEIRYSFDSVALTRDFNRRRIDLDPNTVGTNEVLGHIAARTTEIDQPLIRLQIPVELGRFGRAHLIGQEFIPASAKSTFRPCHLHSDFA